MIAFSSGNHAQGVALAAREFGVPAVIIMPSDAPRMKIDNTRALGAEVVLYDRAGEDRDAIGAAIRAERGLTLIKPYDEPQVIAGQGTTGLEIAEDARGPRDRDGGCARVLRRRRPHLGHRLGARGRRARPARPPLRAGGVR